MKYHRLKRRFSKEQVAQTTGIPHALLDKLEEEQEHLRSSQLYMALAKCYGVFVEELLAEYQEEALLKAIPPVRESTVDPRNCVEAWRRERNLNYMQVAQVLGLKTRESGRTVCRNPNPKLAHLRRLAQMEGLSVGDFWQKYNGWEPEEHMEEEV